MFEDMRHIIVLGKTRSGKSVLIRDGLITMLPRFIFFDVEQRDGFNRIVSATTDDFNAVCLAMRNFLTVQFCSRGNSLEEIAKEYNILCKIVMIYAVKHKIPYAIVSDEAADVCNPNKIQPYHYAILRKGLGHGVIHITASQRPQMINKAVLTQSQIKILFSLDDYDIQACRPYIPNIERVKTLRPYEAIIIDGEHTKIIKIKKRF